MNTPEQTHSSVPGPSRLPVGLIMAFFVMVGIGVVGLLMGIGTDPTRAWLAYLVTFLLFLGIGAGGVLFTCVIHMASGKWGRNVKRVAEGLGLFMPMSLLMFLLMIPGLKHVLPWVEHPYGPHWWLDLNFLIVRTILSLSILSAIGLYLIYRSIRVDLGTANDQGAGFNGPIHRLVTRNWKGAGQEAASARKIMGILAPIYTILFAMLLTLVAMDFIMSLKKDWYSTLIGGYYFAGSFYTALAALLLFVIWTRRKFSLHDQIRPNHLHDIAKLTMAFGIVTGDFFYAQLLLIWYGNLPVETSYLLDRWHTPWRAVGIAVMLLCFALPLVAMLNRKLKEKSLPMVIFSTAVLLAMWMERFFIVVPSVAGPEKILFGLTEIFVTLGFVGLLGLIFTAFIHRVPAVVVRDPIFEDAKEVP